MWRCPTFAGTATRCPRCGGKMTLISLGRWFCERCRTLAATSSTGGQAAVAATPGDRSPGAPSHNRKEYEKPVLVRVGSSIFRRGSEKGFSVN